MPNLHIAIDILFGISVFYNTCIYFPQIYRLIKLKRSEELSLAMFALFCITQVIQIAYGYIIAHDYEYAMGMFFVLAACAVTTYLIIYYRLKRLTLKQINGFLIKYRIYIIGSSIIAIISLLLIGLLSLDQLKFILSILFEAVFVIVGFSFIFQIATILKHKRAKEFSVTTFAGFNIIQLITALYAYYHGITSLLIGMLIYLITSGTLTGTILYFKWKNNEF